MTIKKKNHPDNVLIYKKLYINSLVYNISYKNSIGTKLVCIRFNKVDEFIRLYDGTGHLVLFDPEKYDAIYNRIKYLTGPKSNIKYAFSYTYSKIKRYSYHSLPLWKILTFHNVIILIKSVFNKDKKYLLL